MFSQTGWEVSQVVVDVYTNELNAFAISWFVVGDIGRGRRGQRDNFPDSQFCDFRANLRHPARATRRTSSCHLCHFRGAPTIERGNEGLLCLLVSAIPGNHIKG